MSNSRKSDQIFEREFQYAEIQKQRRMADALKGEEIEMEGCTFEPYIRNPRSPRNFEQFLHEQNKHSEKARQALVEMIKSREDLEKEKYQTGPRISQVL